MNIEDYKVPDGFITRKMSSDIKKVMKEHQSKDNSEDGSIDKETAVDIAIAIMKCGQESYFEKPTFYCISYRLAVDGINVVGGLSTKLVISKKDGALLAIWTS